MTHPSRPKRAPWPLGLLRRLIGRLFGHRAERGTGPAVPQAEPVPVPVPVPELVSAALPDATPSIPEPAAVIDVAVAPEPEPVVPHLELIPRQRPKPEPEPEIAAPESVAPAFTPEPEPEPEAPRTVEAEPQLVLDTAEGVLEIKLPPVPAPFGVAGWLLRVGERHVVVTAADDWSDTSSSQAFWEIGEPAAAVEVALAGTTFQTVIPLVDIETPLLAFTENGRPLPRDRVRDGRMWLVHPAGNDLTTDGRLIDIAEIEPGRHAWAKWRFRLVELQEATRLGLRQGGRELLIAGEAAAARLVYGDRLPAVTTEQGDAVYNEPPTVVLPLEADAFGAWTIEVSRLSSAEPEKRCTAFPERMWDGFERPLLGHYAVSVRGLHNRGFRERAFTVAEGLSASPSTLRRRIEKDGLEPAAVHLGYPVGVSVAGGDRIVLDPERTARKTRLSRGTDELTVKIAIPWVSYSITHPAISPVMRHRESSMLTEGLLDHAATLRIHVPGAEAPGEILLISGQDIVHETGPIRPGRDTYTVDLSVFNDTLRAVGHAMLVFKDADGRPSRILACKGPQHSTRTETVPAVAEDRLSSPEAMATEFDQLGIALPEELRLWLVTDDHEEVPAPEPDQTPSNDASAAQAPETEEPAEHVDEPPTDTVKPVETWLESFRSRPGESVDFEPLWMAIDADLRAGYGSAPHAPAVRDAMLDQIEAAIDDLADSDLDADGHTRVLVATGLAALHLPNRRGITQRLWSHAPATAALIDDLQGPTGRRHAEIPREACGPDFDAVYRNPARDPNAHIGKLNPASDALAALDTTDLAAFGAAPDDTGPLMSVESREAAARELASRHRDPLLAGAAEAAADVIAAVDATLDGYLRRHLAQRAHPRPTEPWHRLAHLSTALALAARRAARGDDACRGLVEEHQLTWTHLACGAPRLVTLDLIIAELLMTGTGID